MSKSKLTVRDVMAALAPNDTNLATDDNLILGVEKAIRDGFTDPQDALARAIAWRSGYLAGRSENGITAADPVPAPQPTMQVSLDEAREEARQRGERDGALAERNRIRAILTDPLAENRMVAAKHLAFGTDMRASEALALLFTVQPGSKAEALQSIPATVARACNAEGGLVAYDATAETIAPVGAGGATASASVGFAPAPDPFVKADPNARNRAAWKRTTDALNAEDAQATIHG